MANLYPVRNKLVRAQPADPCIMQSNQLARACYSMTLNEKRLMLLAQSKIFHNTIPGEGTLLEFTVQVADWVEVVDKKGLNQYRDLKNATRQLMKRSFILKQSADMYDRINWVDHCRYYQKEGAVKIRFGHKASQYLIGLHKEFMSIQLMDVAGLNSFHAIRLYEMLMQWRSTGKLAITVNEFKETLELSDKYPKFSKLNQRVIQPALKEINGKTPYNVKLELRPNDRRVTSLYFQFHKSSHYGIEQLPKVSLNNAKKTGEKSEPDKYKSTRETTLEQDLKDTSWAD